VFHYSAAAEPELNPVNSADAAPGDAIRLFKAENAAGRQEAPLGVRLGPVAAAYAHVHFASNPDLAYNFGSACVRFGVAYELA
jgi:cobyrinic acid a,c-diamide synthase